MQQISWENQQCIDQLKQGNLELRLKFYDEFAPVIYGSVCRLVPDKVAQQILLEEIFFQIFKRLPEYQFGRQRFFSWIYSIVQETLLSWHEE